MADGGVGVVGLVLAIPGLVDLGIKYVRAIVHKIGIYRKAGDYLVDHLQEQDIQTSQLEVCLTFVKTASSSFPAELEILVRKALYRLTSALEVALASLEDNIDKKENIKKWRYTMYGRSELKRALERVEKDQLLFYRAVQWAVLSGGAAVEAHLTEDQQRGSEPLGRVKRLKDAINFRLKGSDSDVPKMLLDDKEFSSAAYRPLPHSEIGYLTVKSDDSDIPIALVEYRPYVEQEIKKVRDIALVLQHTSESMAILPCKGFKASAKADPARFELVFPLPTGSAQPRTLRDILLGKESQLGVPFSLTWRLELGLRLATAIMYVHTSGLVHKSIRPENLVVIGDRVPTNVTEQSAKDKSPGKLYLIGFEFARKEEEVSTRIGDDTWWKNIYRHPQRQGVHPETDFNMLHDIYSLGVVLLEIALWRSFVLEETDDRTGEKRFAVNRDAIKISDRKTSHLKSPEEIQKIFVKKAADFIPQVFGDKYRDIVVMCLSCLDEGGLKDIEDAKDKDGITIGMAYSEKVLTILDGIAV
ncbi:uncharacterized protein PV07_11534 [Cladophialophora immunda]|uniref:Protein kinase domain-containing protein n=1 Tax=Cladophialophora immunda TaxID=569365 RepID=A0A0D1Z6R1_9EURO|nr:uncharacterized protein PV07_11534 [Cladophialophora immunda]KIW23326.1 hypothetical protein PV07_11534 [Cladophialophora immunda]